MAKKKTKSAARGKNTRSARTSAAAGGTEKQLVAAAYDEAVKQNLIQYFANSITDPNALDHFLHGLQIYRTAREKLMESL
jgi:hypothetical protein